MAEPLEPRRLLTGTGLIDVQFNVTGDPSYTNPAQFGPAFVGGANDRWNNIRAAYFFNGDTASPVTSSNLALFDSGGNTTAVTLSYTAQFATQPATGPVPPFEGTNFQNLMTAYFTADSRNGGTSTPGVVDFNGLTPHASYVLYLYSGADANGRGTTFTINDTSETATFNTSDSTFISGVNYVKFDAQADGAGEINIAFDAVSGSDEGDFNGIQLEAVLAAPTPLTPANGGADQSLIPTFSWSAVSGATGYEVVYATNEADLPTATDPRPGLTAIEASSTTNSYRPTTALSANTEYFWEVIGTASGLSGASSSVSNFTTGKPTITLSGTTAMVVGTNGDDTDSVSVSNGEVTLTVDGKSRSFQSSAVAQIDITLGNRNDTLSTAAEVTAVSVLGGTGNDSVLAGSADATVHSGSGNDTIVASGKASLIKANGGKDDLVAEAKLDTIRGGGGIDTIDPLKGGDSLHGGRGANFFLDADAKHPDTINGGTGFSFAQFNPADVMSNIFQIIDPPAPPSSDTIQSEGAGESAAPAAASGVTATVVNGELKVVGTPGNDTISLTSDGTNIDIDGDGSTLTPVPLAGLTGIYVNSRGGDNSITVAQKITLPATLRGHTGADTLVGGGGDNVLIGGGGDDSLEGGAGTNLLIPGLQDTFTGTPDGNATLNGGTGFSIADFSYRTDPLKLTNNGAARSGDRGAGETDEIMTNVSAIWGGSGGNTLTGATGGVFLSGGAGANSVHGGGANDLLVGGGGNDTVIVAAEPVSLYLLNPKPNEYGGVNNPGEDILQLDSKDTELT
jgi:Ca2+-binding RTX toxin-like protein